MDAEITVYDISPRGVGFYSKADLPIDFYLMLKFLWWKTDIWQFFGIVRKTDMEDGYNYGCEFVGLGWII